jgi:hypothetical protein
MEDRFWIRSGSSTQPQSVSKTPGDLLAVVNPSDLQFYQVSRGFNTTLASAGAIPVVSLDPHERLVLSQDLHSKRRIVFRKVRGKNVINEPLAIVLGVTTHLSKNTGKVPMKGRNSRVAGIVRLREQHFGDPWRPGVIQTKLLGPST